MSVPLRVPFRGPPPVSVQRLRTFVRGYGAEFDDAPPAPRPRDDVRKPGVSAGPRANAAPDGGTNIVAAPVIYLRPGEAPCEDSYTLVICDPKISERRQVRHDANVTHFVRTNVLPVVLSAIARQASTEGYRRVYVVEPQGEEADIPEVVPDSWLGKWAD